MSAPGEESAACGCRAFLAKGRCGHCDAAVKSAKVAKAQGLMLTNAARSGAETTLTDLMACSATGAIAKSRVALGLEKSDSCFSQLAAKSRGLRGLRVVSRLQHA